MTRVVLASKSASRAAMLRAAGVQFEACGSGVDEDALKAPWLREGRSVRAIAEGLAEAKATAVSRETEALVIGADSTVEMDGRLIGKTPDVEALRAQLLEMRGRAHTLYSAVALAQGGAVVWRETGAATLHMRAFSDAWLDGYLAATGEAVLGSVGGYHLEGLGVQLFESVEGDWFTILGMPMLGLLEALRREGALPA